MCVAETIHEVPSGAFEQLVIFGATYDENVSKDEHVPKLNWNHYCSSINIVRSPNNFILFDCASSAKESSKECSAYAERRGARLRCLHIAFPKNDQGSFLEFENKAHKRVHLMHHNNRANRIKLVIEAM